jgi:hypothetical protein
MTNFFEYLQSLVRLAEKQLWFTSLHEKVEVPNRLKYDSHEELHALLSSTLDKAFKVEEADLHSLPAYGAKELVASHGGH